MTRARIGAVLLALFIAWRVLPSAAVAWNDPLHGAAWRAGISADSDARVAASLADVPVLSGPDDLHHQRWKVLDERTPRRCQVYFLHPFRGPLGLLELFSWTRLSVLLHPRFVQPIASLPIPDSAREAPLEQLPVFLFDLRPGAADLPDDRWVRVAEVEGAVLWREREER